MRAPLALNDVADEKAAQGRCRRPANRLNEPHAPVAQLDRALPSEGGQQRSSYEDIACLLFRYF
jgi:hypothetical protein